MEPSSSNLIELSFNLLPKVLYLYFPKPEECYDAKIKYRRIFDGETVLEKWEIEKMEEFQQYLDKHKYKIDSWWNIVLILRFLYSNKFSFEKTYKAMTSHSTWRNQKYPPKSTKEIQEFLNEGVIYIHGRDCRFRPIIIFKPWKINLKESTADLMIDSLIYFLTYTIENLMLPGQVENWVFLVDLNNMGVSSLPFSSIKKVLTNMQNNFRSRLFVMYLVNAPKTINLVWKMVKSFLEEVTIQKIKIVPPKGELELFNHSNPEQVENCYGGLAPNLEKSFWPPTFPSQNYLLPSEKDSNILLTAEDYYARYLEGKLNKSIVCRDYIDPKIIKPTKTLSLKTPDGLEKKKGLFEEIKENENFGNKIYFDRRKDDYLFEEIKVEEEINDIRVLRINETKFKKFIDSKYEMKA